MEQSQYIPDLLDYIQTSPTAFHAVSTAVKLLEENGFTRLFEEKNWRSLADGRYFVTRNNSSLIGFTWNADLQSAKLQIIGAHTDSPCLKVKPNPVQENQNCLQLGVEVYGGTLLAPWFDRELSLAGRVCLHDADNQLHTALVDFKRPIGIIPSLAIHLDSEANKGRKINKQTDLVPIIGLTGEMNDGFHTVLQDQVKTLNPQAAITEITDFELFFYDANPAALSGLHQEFICGARLDNLLSCYGALQALLHADTTMNCLIVLNDHEEVGSVSASGAQGTFLRDILERLLPDVEQRKTALARSFCISADNAHAVHPNFLAKHDPQHLPQMSHGVVIKHNANQRYASNARTSARFRRLCSRAGVPVQEFVIRSDMACGSTIGPLTAAETGIATVDVGIPSLAMHSIRETAACADCWSLYRVLQMFFTGQ